MLSDTVYLKRFWSHVDKSGDCWLWTGSRDKDGYGRVKGPTGRLLRAHRVAWEITYGDLPVNMLVCHRCDNPGCVRPTHLFLGTQSVNMQDAEQKGRIPRYRGEDATNVKLTHAAVAVIREQAAAGITQVALAKQFDVAPSTVSAIVREVNWRQRECLATDQQYR